MDTLRDAQRSRHLRDGKGYKRTLVGYNGTGLGVIDRIYSENYVEMREYGTAETRAKGPVSSMNWMERVD